MYILQNLDRSLIIFMRSSVTRIRVPHVYSVEAKCTTALQQSDPCIGLSDIRDAV
jgi:hypothetical protein